MIKKLRLGIYFFSFSVAVALLAGCSPDVGSEGWCDNLEERPIVEWTAEEVMGYAEYCLYRIPED